MIALIAAAIFAAIAVTWAIIEKIRLADQQRRAAHLNQHIARQCHCNGPL